MNSFPLGKVIQMISAPFALSNAFILSQGFNFINPRVPSRRAPSFLKSNTAAFLTAVKIGQLLRLGTNILTGSTRKKWSWWYKLRCYTRILSPGKSRKNTLEKVSFFFFSESVYIANQLLTRHSPFAPLGQVDEWTAKPSPFSIQGRFVEIFCLNTEKCVSLTNSDVQTFLEGEENQSRERKTDSYVFRGFGNSIFRGWERKSTTGRFATDRFSAVYLN